MREFNLVLKPMEDTTADFSKCYIEEFQNRKCVCCKQHGAMVCVKSNGSEAVYRCPQAISLRTGNTPFPCYAGCVSIWEEKKE